MKLAFIVIDDSELDCFVSRKIIEHVDKSLNVKTYQNAELAIEIIKDNPIDNSEGLTIILLDLHMPIMNGFQFVEEFEKLPIQKQKKYMIVVLSSTRNANDISRILSYNGVESMLEKPLTLEKLTSLVHRVQQGLN
ncbi:MAG: chemotaxis-specific methylesterase [Mucilaginibacter sp.]|nr:chemotaxis-specific methylesterase [Mucilaginibacter sp.]